MFNSPVPGFPPAALQRGEATCHCCRNPWAFQGYKVSPQAGHAVKRNMQAVGKQEAALDPWRAMGPVWLDWLLWHHVTQMQPVSPVPHCDCISFLNASYQRWACLLQSPGSSDVCV